MSLSERREVESRDVDDTPTQEEVLWSSQSLEVNAGGELVYQGVDRENTPEIYREVQMEVNQALQDGRLRAVPLKTRVRNRRGSPVKIKTEYFETTQDLHVELLPTESSRPSHTLLVGLLGYWNYLQDQRTSRSLWKRAYGYLMTGLLTLTLLLSASILVIWLWEVVL